VWTWPFPVERDEIRRRVPVNVRERFDDPPVSTVLAQSCERPAYLGKSDVFDGAIAAFAVAYADQNERDYDAMLDAIRSGRIRASADASGEQEPKREEHDHRVADEPGDQRRAGQEAAGRDERQLPRGRCRERAEDEHRLRRRP